MTVIDKELERAEKKKAKAHKLLRNNDPVIDPDNYRVSMLLALNHYNREFDNKQKKSWAVLHFGKKVKFNNDFSDGEFKTLGTLCRILDNGYQLTDKHQIVLDNEAKRLSVPSKVKVEVVEVAKKVGPSIQEKMDEKVSEFLGEFAGLVDDYTITGTIPKVDKLVAQFAIRGPMIKKVQDKVANTMAELEEALAGTDKQLNEGYGHFKKAQLKKLLGIYTALIDALGQAKVMTVRKARVTKVKPPAIVAAKVKYQVENKDLKLVSVHPAQVVGAESIYVFNSKYRKLQYYEAITGQTLTWKGTSVMNWDVNKSGMKMIRKPDMLQALDGKRKLNAFYKETKSKVQACSGRIGLDCLIIGVYK